MARLVDGGADTAGAWEYGRLEVLINSVYTIVGERSNSDIGRRGAQVACRSLGFAAGAQLLVGESSPFPGPPGSMRLSVSITCDGSEASLSDCDIEVPDYNFGGDYDGGEIPFAAALICTNPSGDLSPRLDPSRVPCHAKHVVSSCAEVHLTEALPCVVS